MNAYNMIIEKINLRERIHRFVWRQRRCSFGKKNSDKCFYVIRWDGQGPALMGLMCYVLGQIKYAEEQGYIPVVDFKSGMNFYFENQEKIGMCNTWDYFFQSVSPYSLEEVYESKNVVLSSIMLSQSSRPEPSILLEKNKKNLNAWKKICQRYIQPSQSVQKIIDDIKKQHGDPHNFLGVKLRGTDYDPPPKGHYYQPNIDTVIETINSVCNKRKFDRFYFSTEDISIKNRIKSYYGDAAILVSFNENFEKIDSVEMGQRYLSELMFLSNSSCLIGGLNGGMVGVSLFAMENQELITWDLGKVK